MTAVSDNHFTFIETSEQLDAFATDWLPRLDGAALALDIEEDRERHYDPCVALVQLTIETHDFVLDPLSLPPRPLAAVLEMVCLTPSIVVVHGARNDVGANASVSPPFSRTRSASPSTSRCDGPTGRGGH